MYQYRCKVLRVIDGDTVDVDIDLGFGVWLKKQRVRLHGIDTPESRTRDKVEKHYGLIAKKFLKEQLGGKEGPILKTRLDAKGKFGRILGEFLIDDGSGDTVNELMIKEGHAVAYFGQSKDDIAEAHILNRKKVDKKYS